MTSQIVSPGRPAAPGSRATVVALPTAALAAALVRSLHFAPPPAGAAGLDVTGAGEVAAGLLASGVALPVGDDAGVEVAAVPASGSRTSSAGWREREPGYYIVAEGRQELERKLAYAVPWNQRLARWTRAAGIGGYVGSIAAFVVDNVQRTREAMSPFL